MARDAAYRAPSCYHAPFNCTFTLLFRPLAGSEFETKQKLKAIEAAVRYAWTHLNSDKIEYIIVVRLKETIDMM